MTRTPSKKFRDPAGLGRTPHRQGDVLLIPVAAPASARKLESRGLRVDGERTGHTHLMPAEVVETESGTLLHVTEATTLRHVIVPPGTEPDYTALADLPQADHAPQQIAAGWWRPVMQVEYRPKAAPRRRAIVD